MNSGGRMAVVVKDMVGHSKRRMSGLGDNIQEEKERAGPGCKGSERVRAQNTHTLCL